MNKVLFVCKALPFESGGSASIVRNLLGASKKGQIILIGRQPNGIIDFNNLQLPYDYEFIPLSNQKESSIKKSLKFFYSVVIGLKTIRKNNVCKIISVYRDESSFLLGYILSVLSRKQLYVFLTDLYSENYNSKIKKTIQSTIFKKAKSVMCLTTGMKEIYMELYSIDAKVIPHSINLGLQPCSKNTYIKGEVFKILFSGTILYDRLDLLQNLIKEFGDNKDFEIVFLSPHDKGFLIENQLWAENVSIRFASNYSDMMDELMSVDLLYLPLTFKKPNSERSLMQLKSCLATKSFDYLASGVPVLVHSPKEYLTYSFFEKFESAFLLSTESNLKEKVNYIKNNYSESNKIVENGILQVKSHTAKDVYQQFWNHISS